MSRKSGTGFPKRTCPTARATSSGRRGTDNKMPSPKTCLQASLAALLGAIAVLVAAVPVAAQDYPTRPITFIIPFPPGGSTTIVVRSISDKLGEALGQQI